MQVLPGIFDHKGAVSAGLLDTFCGLLDIWCDLIQGIVNRSLPYGLAHFETNDGEAAFIRFEMATKTRCYSNINGFKQKTTGLRIET